MTSPPTNLPKPPDTMATMALVFAALCVTVAYAASRQIVGEIAALGVSTTPWNVVSFIVIAVCAVLFWPATKSWRLAREAKIARINNDAVAVRIATQAARDQAAVTFGWGVFSLLVLGFFSYIFMNNTAVGKTFFLLPLLQEKWWLVAEKFVKVNIVTFVVAEILVLIWGLFVALARMMPGPAGKPIRALAIAYIDIFRGMPAIVTLYLIGFGIPTSGLPEMVLPYVYSIFTDISSWTPRELKDATRVPVMYWCILALTLTYGAYVAEVYRAGIESIHWSQVSAARSLGLSYMQTMRHVVIPQAVRRVVAPLLNDFIGLQKDTALVQILGMVDAFNQSRGISANAFNLSAVTIVAALFVLVTIPQARLVDVLLERDARRMKSGG